MKIAVTGLGLVSAAGLNEKETLDCFRTSQRRAGPVSLFTSPIQAPVFEAKHFSNHYFSPEFRTLNLCLSAVDEALTGARLKGLLKGKRVGIAMGTTIGSILNDLDFYRAYREQGKAPMDAVNRYLKGNLASTIHAFLGTNGPSMTVVNACASSADAIGIAMSWLKSGYCDLAIAGGSDEMNRVPLCGFASLGILSETLCAPFDQNRTGLNLGEGSGVLVLEKESHALIRQSPVRVYMTGYGSCNDAYHLTSPDANGVGLKRAISDALKEANIEPKEISLINAHGTGTKDNDWVEGNVLYQMIGSQAKFLSTKGYTGHTLGAAGSLEAGFTILALEQGWVPASAGFKQKDPDIAWAPVSEQTSIQGRFALSTSLGFGGV